MAYEREPLQAPFGFKGRTVSELWQIATRLDVEGDISGFGLGTQSPLWSDAAIFERLGEAEANRAMYWLTQFALRECTREPFDHPFELFDRLFPRVLQHGRSMLSLPGLRPTFSLNALVAVDNAAWQAHAIANRVKAFDDLIPSSCRPALPGRHSCIGNIPLISFGTPVSEAVAAARGGHAVLKIKIGSDPGRNGRQDEMLEWDCRRISELHTALRDFRTPATANGAIAYYLDANSRYDSLERVQRLLDHCASIGALESVLLLEEPLPEDSDIDVRNLPVRVAADESAHSVADVTRRIDAGYTAIALKPIAKTLSLSLRMAAEAHRCGASCFCADLTVNPILVDWNKNVAARLPALPGMNIAVFESNGFQNYRDWTRMRSYHPLPGTTWLEAGDGQFLLDETFYAEAGGILRPSPHYRELLSLSS